MKSVPVRLLALASALVACSISLSGCMDGDDAPPYWRDRVAPLLTADQDHPISWLILSVEGRGPTPMTIQAIMDTMTQINGEDSHHFMGEHPLQVADDSRDKTWSRIELFEIADNLLNDRIEYRPAFTAFIFLNGKIKEDQPPLGTEMLGISFIFADLMDDGVARVGQTSAPNIGRAEVERAVVIHEFGHAIGLVDSGIPMLEDRIPPEEDDPCQCHSDQPDSVMHHSVSNYQAALEYIVQDGSQLPYTFNEADWKDIRSFQDENRR